MCRSACTRRSSWLSSRINGVTKSASRMHGKRCGAMPLRGSPNGPLAPSTLSQPGGWWTPCRNRGTPFLGNGGGRHQSERLDVIDRVRWSSSFGAPERPEPPTLAGVLDASPSRILSCRRPTNRLTGGRACLQDFRAYGNALARACPAGLQRWDPPRLLVSCLWPSAVPRRRTTIQRDQ